MTLVSVLMQAWPLLCAAGGLAGVIAAIVFTPGGPAFALKHWQLLLCAVLAAGVVFFANIANDRAVKLASAETARDAALKSADEWKAADEKQVQLAQDTATAHAVEQKALINLATAAGSAKQGIANAPGASDRFAYSDAAYGFMRPPGAAPASAPAPVAGVDGR